MQQSKSTNIKVRLNIGMLVKLTKQGSNHYPELGTAQPQLVYFINFDANLIHI